MAGSIEELAKYRYERAVMTFLLRRKRSQKNK